MGIFRSIGAAILIGLASQSSGPAAGRVKGGSINVAAEASHVSTH
jgi:hypothetical protein